MRFVKRKSTFICYFFYRIDELSKLNYSLDIELQKERGNREQMQAKLRLHSSGPKRMPQLQQRSTPDRDS